MSLILQFTDRAINIIKLSSEPGDKGKDVIVRSVTPEDLLGMLPKEEPKPSAEPPLPVGCTAVDGYPWLCQRGNGYVVFRENECYYARWWCSNPYAELSYHGVSIPAIADALRYIVDDAVKEIPELNLIVVANPAPK